MPDEADEVVRSIGLELVTRLAPEELPLYPSLVNQFEGTNDGGGKASSGDQILGFGAGEVMTLLTPVILSFARSFWQALADQAAQTTLRGVLQHLQVRRTGRQHGAREVPRLSEEQVQLVRKVAEQQARRLNVSDEQAGLLADAMVGVLVAPPVS